MFDPNNESDLLAIHTHVLKNLGQPPKDLEFKIVQSDGDEASLKSIRCQFWNWFDDAFDEQAGRIVTGLRRAGYAVVGAQDLEWELHSEGWGERVIGMFMAGVLYP